MPIIIRGKPVRDPVYDGQPRLNDIEGRKTEDRFLSLHRGEPADFPNLISGNESSDDLCLICGLVDVKVNGLYEIL